MATPQGQWVLTKEDLEAFALNPPLTSFYEQAARIESRYVEEGVRRALSLWVSELEPELMFRVGQTRPFGITAKGHETAYVEIEWDDNFYLTGDPIRYPVRQAASV